MHLFAILCFVAAVAADVSELSDHVYNYPQPMGAEYAAEHGSFGSNAYAQETGSYAPEEGTAFEPLQQSPTVTKRFFSYAAADDSDDDGDDGDDDDSYGGENKHYDVVFAKAPALSVNTVLKAFAKHAANQQTAVYVLSKKLGADELGHALRASGIKPNKPEVHFLKYKTPEELVHAQHQVRAQYDALGGHSEFNDEQSAPVRSYVGSLGRRSSYAKYNQHSHHSHQSHHKQFNRVQPGFSSFHTSKNYLPPKF